MSQGRIADPLDPTESRQAFVSVAETPQYLKLRSSFRNFAFPMTLAGLVSYFTFVLLSVFAEDFMAQPFLGMAGLNTGLMIGFLQFAIVWIWTAIYVNYANTRLDPISAEIKDELVAKGAV
ncbi:DUF485 domain-containing protein [Tessaracoccus flavus]|jgi:uncharacterized membrane protein (DUF485 family)|uniref:Uncharacterized protein n=1 Tax=Tessaracoccus flavus TaxID=1610493 RepID=A0A1Q2CDW9_9ACTN|nr:DUF485 domain-containing protein [Tessaracoccus flavus]AQP44270.1 hypothetical protein RPIT_05110 [Tessaracoccus flavus]SDY40143.1 Uncharacterized membrane protein, DUF485 family [Tessaracoccus flavus]